MFELQPTGVMLTIDRIEGDLAVCEKSDCTMIDVPLSEFPGEAREGSILVFDGTQWILDSCEEARRRERIAQKMDDLFK